MNANENQIVVYQPNETVRLDVRLENETVWLTQAQLCELFGVVKSNVSYHLKNHYRPKQTTHHRMTPYKASFSSKKNRYLTAA